MINSDSLLVAGHQPNFFPWFGYFEKILKSDVFCFSDDVQFPKQSYVSRVQIPINNEPAYLILPVERGSKQRIFEKKYLKDIKNAQKIVAGVNHNLGSYPFVSDLSQLMEDFLVGFNRYETIAELNISMIKSICNVLGIQLNCVTGTELGLCCFSSTARLIQRCHVLKSSRYLCGQGADGYQDEEEFAAAKIELVKIDYDLGKSLLGEDLRYSILHSIAKLGIQRIKHDVCEYSNSRGKP